jgi:hypothetical protein
MRTKRWQRLISAWLLLSVALTAILFAANQRSIEYAVQELVRAHLLLSVDESLFSDTKSRSDDQQVLQRIGQQINAAIQDLVVNRWYSAQRECVVRLRSIDRVTIDEHPVHRITTFGLLRNQLERQVEFGVSCTPNWSVAIGIAACLGLLFFGIGFFLRPPLSKVHRQWINYLLQRGYSATDAFDIIHPHDAPHLTLGPVQLACLEQLHDRQKHNFSRVLEMVVDQRVAALDIAQVDWFLLGLQGDPGNLNRALALAGAEDSLRFDLARMTVSVRGLSVPMSGTPLFYYAWYAMRRISGDGWITNPASNRPDPVLGGELVDLMSRFDGHAKAINELERTGLRARTLDQNRSKIKDDLVAVLGQKLAQAYFFESGKHHNGIQMRYRLQLDARYVHIATELK